jgi:hypothetical protein
MNKFDKSVEYILEAHANDCLFKKGDYVRVVSGTSKQHQFIGQIGVVENIGAQPLGNNQFLYTYWLNGLRPTHDWSSIKSWEHMPDRWFEEQHLKLLVDKDDNESLKGITSL